MNHVREMENGQTIYCLEVLHAVQTDSRTAGCYWGDVRGKAAVGIPVKVGIFKNFRGFAVIETCRGPHQQR